MQSNLELHPECAGCKKINALDMCSIYLEPTKQWAKLPVSGCAGRPKEEVEVKPKGYVDPIKASKRGIKQ